MSLLDNFCTFYQHLGKADLSDLHHIYTDDVCFIDPIATHHGIVTVKRYFERLMISTKQCAFKIHNIIQCSENTLHVDFVVNWTMDVELNNGRKVSLDGLTELKVNNKGIYYHRDYYDLGQMVYEHIPVFGAVIRYIKKRLSI